MRTAMALVVCLGGCNGLLGIEELQLRDDAASPDLPDAVTGDAPSADGTSSTEHTITFQDGTDGYAGTKDTYLRSDGGAGNSHATDATWLWETEQDKTGLLRFDDIFAANLIPPGAVIMNATLTLQLSNAGSQATIKDVAIDWAETATWNNFGTAAGVDATDVGATVATIDAPFGTTTANVTASVARWSAAPTMNHGWIFIPLGDQMAQIVARDAPNATAGLRPKLTVTYLN